MYKVIAFVLSCLIFIVFFIGCQRAPVPGFGFDIPFKRVSAKEEAFYDAVTVGKSIDVIESYLKDGHDPNFMNARTAIPWHNTNPLWCVCNNYNKAELFIKYGADVNRRPYLYEIIFGTPILSERYPKEELLANVRTRHEDKVYSLVKLFLEAGANPNSKGAPNSILSSFNLDEAYKKYFEEEGMLPINNAIAQSTFTIVDLLIENGAIIDETSLEAAKRATTRIGNDDMEKYIQTIWEKRH